MCGSLSCHSRFHQCNSVSVLSHFCPLSTWIFSRTTEDGQTLEHRNKSRMFSCQRNILRGNLWCVALDEVVNKERSHLQTHLSEGPSCQTHLSSCPQYHSHEGGQCHAPAQCVRPLRIAVPAVDLQVVVISQVQDEGSLRDVKD